MKKFFAVILAGGAGTRLGGEAPKQFLPLGGKPVITWAVEAFSGVREIGEILIVTPEAHLERARVIIKKHRLHGVSAFIAGGDTRQGSSYNALVSRPFEEGDIIVFHDAARPFVSPEVIVSCMQAADTFGAAAAYVKAVDTITEGVDGFVASIPERDRLHYTQTPQAFRYGIIRGAHEKAIAAGVLNASDDVKLVLNAGHRVKMVVGDYRNIKITTQFDYEMARCMASDSTL